MSLFNTPSQYGGGKDKAKPVFEKAVTLFNAEQPSGFNPAGANSRPKHSLYYASNLLYKNSPRYGGAILHLTALVWKTTNSNLARKKAFS